MSFLQYAFRTAVFQSPQTAPAGGEPALFFWTFHGDGDRAEKGFIYQTEIHPEHTMSKRASDRVDWQTARSLMADFEAEAVKTARRVNENDADIRQRLSSHDTYSKAAHGFDSHPLSVQENDIARLQELAAAAPRLGRRPKPRGGAA